MKVTELKPGDTFCLSERKNSKQFRVALAASGMPSVIKMHPDNNFRITESSPDFNKILVLVDGCRQLILDEGTDIYLKDQTSKKGSRQNETLFIKLADCETIISPARAMIYWFYIQMPDKTWKMFDVRNVVTDALPSVLIYKDASEALKHVANYVGHLSMEWFEKHAMDYSPNW